ncbi:MAG: nucleotidyltransferase domain-containing protein [Melioribacteraceae bacterium]
MVLKNQILQFIKENETLFRSKYHIVKLGLFGSYSRNEQDELSDIDLLIEFEPRTENIFRIKNEVRELFRQNFNMNIDICREKYIKPIFREQILREATYAYQAKR